MTPRLDPTSSDPLRAAFDGQAPQQQWKGRSLLSFGRTQLDASIARIGELRQYHVPAYTRLDLRVERPITQSLSIGALGQNLTDERHMEFATAGTVQAARPVPRSASIFMTWRSR